jgi:hypothetical protein
MRNIRAKGNMGNARSPQFGFRRGLDGDLVLGDIRIKAFFSGKFFKALCS